ncbi:PREDICTED: uncharacterized protein LOC104607657 isoform X1 [Nelumbo nucifera]|uniref:Uncharacterized protein LOC104607657 isoform X1 n=1 Tax=Nelumbo nucifera TaxID=4432 RepID=A0A1U8AU88_NELNU|nr:PREDICTED: uncharacterized protein LOC104607657 isoform X1 [Nelumbo nucifera]
MHIFPFCSRNLRAPGARVLYLSGSPGTTVSHVSHIVRPFFRLIETTFLSNLMLTGQQFCEDWSTLKKKYISLFEDDLPSCLVLIHVAFSRATRGAKRRGRAPSGLPPRKVLSSGLPSRFYPPLRLRFRHPHSRELVRLVSEGMSSLSKGRLPVTPSSHALTPSS